VSFVFNSTLLLTCRLLTATTAWGRVTHIPYPISICIKLLGVAVVRAVVTHITHPIIFGVFLIHIAMPV
jgi:hypothetical protein